MAILYLHDPFTRGGTDEGGNQNGYDIHVPFRSQPYSVTIQNRPYPDSNLGVLLLTLHWMHCIYTCMKVYVRHSQLDVQNNINVIQNRPYPALQSGSATSFIELDSLYPYMYEILC